MRILQLIHTAQRRGAETFAIQLSENLRVLGCHVDIATIYSNPDTDFSISLHDFGFNKAGFLPRLGDLKKVQKFIVEGSYDVVQANAGDTLKYASMSKIIYGFKAPLIFRNASTMSQYMNNPFKKFFNGQLLRKADHIASVSEMSRTDIINLFPHLKNKTTVLPIGIEINTVVNPVTRTKSPVIIHVGGFTFEKDHESVLRIFSEVHRQLPDVTLWLVGDGPRRSLIEQQVVDQKLNDHVRFFGFVSNPMDFISAADVLILPSKIEGLPGVILEAFYCKIPVVAYNTGGIPEILSEDTGFLVEKGDEQQFVDRLRKILLGEGFRTSEQKVITAHEYVKSTFTNDQLAKRFLSLYEQVIHEN